MEEISISCPSCGPSDQQTQMPSGKPWMCHVNPSKPDCDLDGGCCWWNDMTKECLNKWCDDVDVASCEYCGCTLS
jgi:hypothetical protein